MERERDVLRIAARLHDVGKVGISDVILKKPGRLTAEEYSVMKEHTVFGARLFGGNESVLDRAAIEVTLHHHERWDGGGYPGDRDGEITSDSVDAPPSSGIGLKGEDIPLFARIVSVADVYDALSSKRMYKEAWPEDRVLAEMKVNAGKQFDPELIEIMFENVDLFRAIHEKYNSSETTNKADFKKKII
jgi:HD-GYP domain-containing protein (c-di-GMP phosphodiesterase class II)